MSGARSRRGSAGRGQGGAEVIDLTKRLNRWRNATYAVSALAATLLLFVAVKDFYPRRAAAEADVSLRCCSATRCRRASC